jgi:CRISPR-associated protein Csd2
MSALTKKIDFAIIMEVKNANPNGDPLNGNRPRTDYEGLGEITDVCLKRKIRDRLVERYMHLSEEEKGGQAVFVQSDDRKTDSHKSLKARAEDSKDGLGKDALKKGADKDKAIDAACKKWVDVRAFGQLFAFGKSEGADGVSIPVRGPVTIQSAFSLEPVGITSTQITKSTNSEPPKKSGDENSMSSDRMGMKHRVDKGIYVTYGSMNPQLAEKTQFSDDDAEVIKGILPRLFENDASSARPEGSMRVLKVIWWKHGSKPGQYSSAKVHGSLKVGADGSFDFDELDGLTPQQVDGF